MDTSRPKSSNSNNLNKAWGHAAFWRGVQSYLHSLTNLIVILHINMYALHTRD